MRYISINGLILDSNKVPIVKNNRSYTKHKTTSTTSTTTTTTTTIVPPNPSVGPSGSGDVIITIKFVSNPTSASSIITKLKYGKFAAVNMEEDDQPADFINLVNYLQGGGPAFDGVTYPGKTYTDGCGNNVKWTAAVACNVRNNYTHDFIMDPPLAASFGTFPVTELPGLVAKGCLPIPHGYYHFDDDNAVHNPPSAPYWYKADGFNKSLNLSECVKYIWQNTGGFLPRYVIIPQDSGGYNVQAKAQGLLAQSSATVTDGEAEFPHPPELYALGNTHINDVITQYSGSTPYATFRRYFVTNWDDISQTNGLRDQFDNVVSIGTLDAPQLWRFATHGYSGGQWTPVKSFLDYMDTNDQDKVWFTTLQELLEYLETRRLVVKTETLSADTLTIKLNYNGIPIENYFRDLTLKVSSNVAIQSISITNAQGSSYNTSTGLINIYNKRVAVAYPYSQKTTSGGGLVTGLIPVDTKDIWMDNNQQGRHDTLIDGNLTNNYAPVGNKANLIYPNYDLVINLERFRTTVSQVQISFGGGSGGTTQTQIVLVKQDGTEVIMGTWTQNGFNQTDTFTHSGTFKVSKLILRAVTNLSYGAEIRITGTYQPLLSNPFTKPRRKLGYFAGWNIHPWNLCTNTPHSIDATKMAAFKSMDMFEGSIRCYDDWYAVQDLDGKWRIGTEVRGFPMDLAYADLKSSMPNLVKWRCLQNQSLAIQQTWNVADATKYLNISVTNYQDNGFWGVLSGTVSAVAGTVSDTTYFHIYNSGIKIDVAEQVGGTAAVGQSITFNVGGSMGYTNGQVLQFRKSQRSHVGVPWPADNNLLKDIFTPYDLVAYAAFVYASRLGKNPNVPDYPNVGGSENPMTKGGNLVEVFEFGNEWNAFWTGWNGFWNGKSFFYAWSMMYDGHMGTYTNRGIKQADSSAKLATTGLATDKLDIMYGAYRESKSQRGYNPDGTVNVPWDIINIHMYSSAGGQYSGSEGGLPPEQGMLRQIREYVWFVENYSPKSELWISEWGWDANQNSPLAAKTYGQYTNGRQVAAMWHVRAMLLFAKEGLDRAQAYRLYQDSNEDDTNSTQFATMAGLRENSPGNVTRTVVGDYFKQIQEFRNYTYSSEVNTNITGVYCYKFINGTNTFYALWSEENTNIVSNSPVFTERTGTFPVPVPNNSNLKIRQFVDDGSGVMSTLNVTASGTTYTTSYGSKPKIIQIL
jgi:hypothetical protein